MPYKDRERQLAYQRNHDRNRRAERRQRLLAGRACERCGFDDPRALEFHHRDPDEKSFTVMRNINWRMELLLKEAEKCEVLCANCHSIEHR